nr:hypothetical protein [uncultured Blautia sp.]
MFVSRNEEISAIKMAMSSLHYEGISIKATFFLCIERLLIYYDEFNDISYIKIAYRYILAYLQMGFIYSDYEDLFDKIAELLGTSRTQIILESGECGKKIKLNKYQIRKIIRRWSSSKYHTMTIDEVIEDIIFKVRNKLVGIYRYNSNKKPDISDEDLSNDLYELIVTFEESYLRDVRRGKYYTFMEEKSNESCNS